MEPKEVDEALESDSLNLNWLEAIKFAQIINYLKPDKAIVDCPSPNTRAYKEYLMEVMDINMKQVIHWIMSGQGILQLMIKYQI